MVARVAALPLSRILVWSAAWVAVVAGLPLLALGLGKTYAAWRTWKADGAETFFIRVRITQWVLPALLVATPPAAVLAVWSLGRARH